MRAAAAADLSPPPPIEDYALIGDCTTAALVSRAGAVDWLCWPRFDSPACFAALLGTAGHGRWRIAPRHSAPQVQRAYRGASMVLETRFLTPQGEAALIDFMPLGGPGSHLVRIVEGRTGRVDMTFDLTLRGDYGAQHPALTPLPGGGLATAEGLELHTPLALPSGTDPHAAFAVAPGQRLVFILGHGPALPDPEAALVRTQAAWEAWAAPLRCDGPDPEAVRRSLLTLKALTFAPTGGMVAAPTTSLPEAPGGCRNWDYRFCWLRDAALSLASLMRAGSFAEADAWRGWLLRAVDPAAMQIMYGLAGERLLAEQERPDLPGYQGARPVRIGNAAHGQRQLDVWGELAEALDLARLGGPPEPPGLWALQGALTERLAALWDQPDEGIWEVRGGARHFVHSKVMAWVALDRAIRGAERAALPAPLERWRAVRAAIHASVCAHGFSPRRNSFVQSYGGEDLDAALLLIPLVGFLPPSDPRVRGTVAAIEAELLSDGLVRRYNTAAGADGLPPGEGAFLACSFWLVEAWAQQGRQAEARALFARLLALRNDVGLLAEEYDPAARRQLGNFPQAFSHLALIDAARALGR